MKKRTKKKLVRIVKETLKWIFKILILYPIKAISFVVQLIYYWTKHKIVGVQKKRSKKKIQEKKPKVEAEYDAFKVVKAIEGKVENFERKLYKSSSTIGIILGARGTGKSAIGMRLLENFKVKGNKKVYALGFQEEAVPDWIKVVEEIEDIHNDSVVLIDEGGITFSSRNAMSNPNKLLSELLLIARHKDLSVIFITQNSSNLEINAIRQADYLILKPSSLLQKDFERKKIKEVYVEVKEDFKELKGTVGLTYIYADSFRGFVQNSLPSFWSEKASKGFRGK